MAVITIYCLSVPDPPNIEILITVELDVVLPLSEEVLEGHYKMKSISC